MNEIYITKHAYQRAKDRCGWNRSTTDRMLRKVASCGINVLETMGKVRPWAESHLSKDYARESKIYGNWLYIITNNRLITVYQIPAKIRMQRTKNHISDAQTA